MSIENWSLGYNVIRGWVRIIYRLVQKNIIINGRENLSKDHPIIFAPNHQNALLDALSVLMAMPFQPVWLTRADIFNAKTVAVLRFLKMIPVYRIRDGKDNLSKNDEVFAQALKVLENGKQMALFPEGTHSGKRQSLAHKKAVPRIAFMAEEKNDFKLGLQVVPVGIYYSHYHNFHRYTIVNFGKPIEIRQYQEQYKENVQQALMTLRKDLYEALIPLTVHIPSKTYYDEYEQLIDLLRTPIGTRNGDARLDEMQLFHIDQQVIEKVHGFEEKDTNGFEVFAQQVGEFSEGLKKIGVDTKTVEKPLLTRGAQLLGSIKFLLLSPIAFYGYLLHYLPFSVPSKLIRKKIRDHIFWGTFEIVSNVILLTVFYLIYGLVCWFATHSIWETAAFLISLPWFGKAAWEINESFKRFKKRLIFRKLMRNGDHTAKSVSEMRKQIIDQYFKL